MLDLKNLASDAFTITPGATDLTDSLAAIYIGGVGDVVVTTLSGRSITFASFTGFLPMPVKRVTSIGNATSCIGLLR